MWWSVVVALITVCFCLGFFGRAEEADLPDNCTLARDRGSGCRARRFFFDGLNGRCEAFWFRGEGGNANNFPSRESCDVTCPGAMFCYDRKDPGSHCGGIRFFYNRLIGRCAKFKFKGLGGNGNNFRTRRACQTACSLPSAPANG